MICKKNQRLTGLSAKAAGLCQAIGCRLWSLLCNPHWQRLGMIVAAVGIMSVCLSALADGTDILQGTDASLWATLNGTGKKYIYAIEGILGLASYMKTKNLLVLTGIIGVSIFFNVILTFAGESA